MPSLQIRDVPEDVHRQLKSRAALAGQSLSEYALAELRRSLDRPTMAEVVERVAALPTTGSDEPPADALHRARDER